MLMKMIELQKNHSLKHSQFHDQKSFLKVLKLYQIVSGTEYPIQPFVTLKNYSQTVDNVSLSSHKEENFVMDILEQK